MCRKVVFCGICTLCDKEFDWEEFSQELPCLEAKNNGVFGLCGQGIDRDEKPHDQECVACEATSAQDEGYADGMEEFEETFLFFGGGDNNHKNVDGAAVEGQAATKFGYNDADQGYPEQDDGNRKKKKQRTS